MSEGFSIRDELTSEQRTAELGLTIDPGFVHQRKIETLLGRDLMRHVDEAIRRLPELPDYMRRVRVDHIYTKALLLFCAHAGTPSLLGLLAARRGHLFCSIVELGAAQEIEAGRAINSVETPGVEGTRVDLEYSTDHIVASTTRSELRRGASMAVVAELRDFKDGVLTFHPLLMGGPWLNDDRQEGVVPSPEWLGQDFYEIFVEDIDEFSAVRGGEIAADFNAMRRISESAFKACLAEILGDSTTRDWGGETSDHFAAHLHLNGRATTAAFLLKGPARFAPMALNHLGKNNDQIYRLAQEPAQLLVVQHSHDITSPVRATLRAFAVQPGNPRRYCLMDGRDSLRVLTAYGKLERALELSSGSDSSSPT